MEKENVWSTSDILANRNNWSLAADVELLKHLQALSEKIFSKAASTLHSLNSFENDINQTCISIANTSNKFKALSDTQFIESKVQEESSDINEPSSSQIEPPADRGNENITVKLKEALENGFQVLDTQYDIIPVTGSDSEDDEPQEILLRARNPYLSRRLPHIIGSEEFTRNDNLGLIDSSSSEEDEEEEDEDDDDDNTDDDNEQERKDVRVDSDEEIITIQKPPSPKPELVRPRTEIIRISSSDSEDSELSNPYEESIKQEKIISSKKNMSTEKSRDNEPAQNSNSFADHLSAALKNNPRNIYNIVPPDFGDTPPPFPAKDNSVSSDDGSEESDDLFATKKSTKHSISNTIYKSNYDNESDEDDNRHIKETAVIPRELDASGKTLDSRKASIASKTSQHSDLANSSSVVNEASAKDVSVAPLPKPKFADSNINSINKKMVSAINAELNAKLNLKSPSIKSTENHNSAQTSTKSPETRTPVETSAKPSESNTPIKTSKPKAPSEQMPSTGTKKDSKKSALFDKLVDEVDNENDNEDDLFRGISSVKKSTSKSKKSKGLFDDGDNIDDLFSPVKSAQTSSKKSVDLFSSESSEPAKPEKPMNESTVQPPVVDLFKNSNLFASDSDSEDDIFSIIKSQKKPATDIFKTKTDSLFENNPSDSKQTPIPSNDTASTKPLIFDPVIKSAPTEIKSSSLFAEEKLPSGNLKTSAKLADSAKPSIDKTNVSVDVASASKNNLFESTNKKKTSEDLFHSDGDDEDDLFSKSTRIKSADELPSADENTDVTKTRVQSSTNIGKNTVEKKTVPEIAKNNRLDSSNESINQEENSSSQMVKNTAQPDKPINIFAKFQPPKLSSSSEDEDEKQENTSFDAPQTSKNDKERTDTTLLQKKDELFNESSIDGTEDIGNIVSPQKEDIFGKYGEFSTSSKDSKDDDMFGESYGSRSAMFLPPKDDLSDDFFEDEDIKASNYLSQEEEDLFDEKLGSPPFQEVSPYNDIFGERSSAGISSESLKNSIITDTVPVEDLFAKPTSSFLPANLFANNNLFGEEKDDLKGDEKLLGKTASEKLNLNSDHDNRSKKDEEIGQNDSNQKPLIPGEEKIDSVVNIPSSKSKDGLFNEPKESDLFNFTEKDLYGSDSDIFGVISVKNKNPILVTDNVTEAEKSDQIKSSEKISSPDDFQDQNKKSDENLQDDSASKKTSPSSKIGKISTTMFEKANTEKKQGEDVQDGNLFAKSAPPEPVSATRSTPGKLAMGRGLNINVNALLPGGNWSSKMKSKQSSEQVTPDEKQVVESADVKESQDNQDNHEQSTGLLNNVAKERPKLSGKRRPPSRKARKSRILNNDIFGDQFGTESFPEEDKSSIPKDSPKLQKKVEVEKTVKTEKTIDNLFSNIENKTDDLFGITKTKEESNIKQSGATSNSQISNVSSSREESDNDLNLDINSSLNPLPSLTKSRAKLQKRSSAAKKPSDILPVISNEKIPSEPHSKPSVEKSEIFVDKTPIQANPSKTTLPSTKPAAAKSIFDSLEDDDDDLFEIVKSKKPTEEKPAKKIIEEKPPAKAEVKIETKAESKPSQQQPKAKLTQKSTNMDIFNDDDDDEMFASAKKKLPSNKLSKKSSLFEDNDDEDLFGNKTSMPNRKTSVPDPVASSAKTKALNEKPRIVKLRSEAVQKDPLTGKDITGPL